MHSVIMEVWLLAPNIAMKSLMQILAVAAHWVFIKLGTEVKY